MYAGSVENLMANEEYWELRNRNSQAWHDEYMEDLRGREENGRIESETDGQSAS
ncbi:MULTISPECIES: hypothetical protein [Listeria]|uniref:hypothetical protein n=1 Tax=Listeria TaxID=1637 RepID=UPI000669D0CC|nr:MULTISPECIES: hypothetical protein [Listeria]KMT62533.1 hypothetical protein X559_1071 [Listeria newyorkensis]SQC55340.1 Uncharacterised protein [Listeria newyorkensis]